MKIVYCYDVEGWALHNLGVLLRDGLSEHGLDIRLRSLGDFIRAPESCDVLYFAYSGLYEPSFPFRRHAGALACTVHDPLEVSFFTDRLDWHALPLRRLPLAAFDRVGTTSDEMHALLGGRLGLRRVYLTRTFPHDADAIRAAARARGPRGDGRVGFFSATNAAPRYGWRQVLQRFRRLGEYSRDERGRLSPRQLRSILIRTNRKNLALLEDLRAEIGRRPGAAANFLHSRATFQPRREYVEELVASDVYVCTSFMEGGPLPVMEAVLAGLAVISTPVGQVGEWVTHGESGFLCRSRDEFVAAIDAYLGDPALLRRHQRHAAARAEGKRFEPAAWIAFLTGSSDGGSSARRASF